MNGSRSLSVRRDYNLDAIAAGGGAAPSETLRLAKQDAYFGSVTVNNFSNATVALYFDRPLGTVATTTIPAAFYQTTPVGCETVAFAIIPPKGNVMTGTVLIEATTDRLTAAGGVISSIAAASFIWDQSSWDANGVWG